MGCWPAKVNQIHTNPHLKANISASRTKRVISLQVFEMIVSILQGQLPELGDWE